MNHLEEIFYKIIKSKIWFFEVYCFKMAFYLSKK
jgi:hypothetical protein